MTATDVRQRAGSAATRDVTSPVAGAARRAWWESAALPVLVVVVLGAFIAWRSSFVFEGTRTFTLFDDAMVSMRYAHNLATGHGLVYNSGEHVEGYTNFLWTLWMTLLHLLPIPRAQLSAWVSASGLACVAVTVVLAGQIGARLVPGRAEVHAFAMWAVALWYPLLFWSVRGLEPGFLAAVVAGVVLVALRIDDEGPTRASAIGLGALLVAGLLTRTDFVVLAAVVLVWLARRPGRARTTAAVVAGVLVLVLAAHTAARLGYYGDALPNTYALKLEGVGIGERISRGVRALGSVVLAELAIVIALAAIAVWWLRDARAVLLASLFGAAAAYSVYVGGDAWEYNQYDNRYLATVVPLLLVLAAAGVVQVARCLRHSARWGIALGLFALLVTVVDVVLPTDEAGLRVWWNIDELRTDHWVALAAFFALGGAAVLAARRKARPAVVATAVALGVVLFAMTSPWANWSRTTGDLVPVHDEEARIGMRLGEIARPGASIATPAAGNMPYWSGLRTVDLLGKADRHIASEQPRRAIFVPGHNKWDYAYSICRLRPDLVTELWQPTASDRHMIERCGYRRIVGSWYVRDGQRGFPMQQLLEVVWFTS